MADNTSVGVKISPASHPTINNGVEAEPHPHSSGETQDTAVGKTETLEKELENHARVYLVENFDPKKSAEEFPELYIDKGARDHLLHAFNKIGEHKYPETRFLLNSEESGFYYSFWIKQGETEDQAVYHVSYAHTEMSGDEVSVWKRGLEEEGFHRLVLNATRQELFVKGREDQGNEAETRGSVKKYTSSQWLNKEGNLVANFGGNIYRVEDIAQRDSAAYRQVLESQEILRQAEVNKEENVAVVFFTVEGLSRASTKKVKEETGKPIYIINIINPADGTLTNYVFEDASLEQLITFAEEHFGVSINKESLDTSAYKAQNKFEPNSFEKDLSKLLSKEPRDTGAEDVIEAVEVRKKLSVFITKNRAESSVKLPPWQELQSGQNESPTADTEKPDEPIQSALYEIKLGNVNNEVSEPKTDFEHNPTRVSPSAPDGPDAPVNTIVITMPRERDKKQTHTEEREVSDLNGLYVETFDIYEAKPYVKSKVNEHKIIMGRRIDTLVSENNGAEGINTTMETKATPVVVKSENSVKKNQETAAEQQVNEVSVRAAAESNLDVKQMTETRTEEGAVNDVVKEQIYAGEEEEIAVAVVPDEKVMDGSFRNIGLGNTMNFKVLYAEVGNDKNESENVGGVGAGQSIKTQVLIEDEAGNRTAEISGTERELTGVSGFKAVGESLEEISQRIDSLDANGNTEEIRQEFTQNNLNGTNYQPKISQKRPNFRFDANGATNSEPNSKLQTLAAKSNMKDLRFYPLNMTRTEAYAAAQRLGAEIGVKIIGLLDLDGELFAVDKNGNNIQVPKVWV